MYKIALLICVLGKNKKKTKILVNPLRVFSTFLSIINQRKRKRKRKWKTCDGIQNTETNK